MNALPSNAYSIHARLHDDVCICSERVALVTTIRSSTESSDVLHVRLGMRGCSFMLYIQLHIIIDMIDHSQMLNILNGRMSNH